MAETRKEANAAFDLFVETYGVKYEKAVAKLVKDRSELLAFYDFPAEHWKHIRTTNPIESVFATVRNRTRKTKGCLNRKTALAMVYRLMILLGTLLRNTLSDNGQPRKSGGRSPDQTVYPKSFRGLNSRTASSKFKSPPDEGRHQLLGISREVLVEALQPGDPIITADGREVLVRWVGKQTVYPFFAKERAQPVCIRQGALGPGKPHTDLIVTADHGIDVDGFLVNASALVNGDSIYWVPMADLGKAITFYHIETEAHDVILANGVTAESYVDVPTRRGFDNFAEYEALYGPERIIPEMNRPRISSARLLPQGIREMLGLQSYTLGELRKAS